MYEKFQNENDNFLKITLKNYGKLYEILYEKSRK